MLFLFFFQFEARYLYKQGRGSNLNGCKTVKHDQKHLFRTVVLLLQGKSEFFPCKSPVPGSKPLNCKFLQVQSWKNLFGFIGLVKGGRVFIVCIFTAKCHLIFHTTSSDVMLMEKSIGDTLGARKGDKLANYRLYNLTSKCLYCKNIYLMLTRTTSLHQSCL